MAVEQLVLSPLFAAAIFVSELKRLDEISLTLESELLPLLWEISTVIRIRMFVSQLKILVVISQAAERELLLRF